ncbi:MAG TPA: nucleotidyltransferase domain-containing protein [Bdellovibrionota bacterium]|nr:nucleotidyltransferase domain-containing protein [Bdellovibrionota bacterium]
MNEQARSRHSLPESFVSEIVRRVVRRFKPEKIILFGSYARGTPGPDSDVDLMIVMMYSGSKRENRIEIRKALHGIGRAKDIVLVSPQEFDQLKDVVGTIVYPVSREGVTLYTKAA